MEGRKEKATGILWHEPITERSTPDVASTYIKLIRENRVTINFIIWLDNYLGQNKNWYLYTALPIKSIQKTTQQKPSLEVFQVYSYVYISR